MADAPLTRVTLLNRLKSGQDLHAWTEFIDIYGPLVYGFARKRGLQDADAADLMQEVLRSVARHAGKMEYNPAKGTFRGWLYTVTRNKIYNFMNTLKNRPRPVGDSAAHERLEAVADPASEETNEEWEKEYQRRLSAKAMDRVKVEFHKSTWEAFWGTAVEGRSAAEVGKELNMSPGAVYVAKSRVLARLRDEVKTLQQEADAT